MIQGPGISPSGFGSVGLMSSAPSQPAAQKPAGLGAGAVSTQAPTVGPALVSVHTPAAAVPSLGTQAVGLVVPVGASIATHPAGLSQTVPSHDAPHDNSHVAPSVTRKLGSSGTYGTVGLSVSKPR